MQRHRLLVAAGGSALMAVYGRAALLQEALDGPMRDTPDIVYCTRARYDDGHWYANIGYYCDDEAKKAYAGNGQPAAGAALRRPSRGQGLAARVAHGLVVD